jgi:glycosyltransferase involved in cell wall biosynthesis
MRISYVFPAYYNAPIGGYHVHYEYANRLARAGHRVTLIFPHSLQDAPARWRYTRWAVETRLRNRPLIGFYSIDKKVSIRLLPDLVAESLPDADVLIATAWQTAEVLAGVPARCGQSFYIVYDYEYWMTADPETKARIESTYRAGFKMIATSNVVEQTIRECGGHPIATIPCGLDFTAFGCDQVPEARQSLTLGFPARRETFKGTPDAVDAAVLLRARYGDALQVACFGTTTARMPDWIVNHGKLPTSALRDFYNCQSVFLLPSHFEGWGLTGVEAMACGAALVVADNGGSRDYAFDGETAIVVKPGRPDQIFSAVDRLFTNHVLRLQLANSGRSYVQRFSWEAASKTLEALLRA